MITAFFFQYNKIEFNSEEKREKKLRKRVEERCVSVHGLYFVVDNVQFGVMNQINIKLICKHGKWKMILYANQEGNIYSVSFHRTFLYDVTAATAGQSNDRLTNSTYRC